MGGNVTTTNRRRWLAGALCAIVLCFGLAFAVTGCAQSTSKEGSGTAEKKEATQEPTTRSFTDSAGRTVEVPATIDAVAPSGHTATQVMLTMAPDKLVGLSQELTAEQTKYLGSKYADLPVFGAAFGSKGDLNKEAVAAAGAQILIDTGEYKDGIAEDLDAMQEQLGIPCVFIETTLDNYGAAYEMLGELLGTEDRGKELSDYCKAAYDETTSVMAKIPADKWVTVAYMLGDKGTNTIAKNSYQGQVVDMVANNVADLGKVSGSGTGVETSLEQLSIWNPQVILFQAASIYDTVKSDPAWASLSAIESGAYYEVPNEPWCWLNNPPTVNQVLGMQWLPRLLYPDQFDDDMYDVVSSYYKTFYNYDLSQSEFDSMMTKALPKK